MLENTSVGYIVACISVTFWGVFCFLDPITSIRLCFRDENLRPSFFLKVFFRYVVGIICPIVIWILYFKFV
ncbi:hypothetical protein ASG99_27865 [Bacillus sp. Soil768D1]|nr:hypothetical protein ASG99_27865 [Bacillus sp. Soil768D1]